MTILDVRTGSTVVRVDGLDEETNELLNHLLGVLADKRGHNDLRDLYYDSKQVARRVSNVVPMQYQALGNVLGWAGQAVDALARRCNLDGFVWADGDLDGLGYREFADANLFHTEVDQAIVSTLIHGVSFGVVTQGGDGEPPALLHFKTALDATGDWNPRTRRLDNLLSVTDRDHDGQESHLVLYLPGQTVTIERDEGLWYVEDVSTHPWGVPAERLAYKPRLGRVFGSSRISRPIMGLQSAAIREAIRLEGHMDVYSFPELWMLGADPSIFKDEHGHPISKWEVMLGRIKGIPDDENAANPRADVKQFAASSPAPHLAALNAYAKMFAREAKLPDSSVAITDVANPTSADAYNVSQRDLVTEAEGTTDDFAPPLRWLVVKALAIANGENQIPPEWTSIEPAWRDPRYESRAAMADAGSKQVAAAPWLAETTVGLELLGLNPQQIRRALAERQRAEANSRLDALLTVTPPPPPSV